MSAGDKFAICYSTYGMNYDEFTQSMLALAFTDAYGPQRWWRGQMHKRVGPYLSQNRSDISRIFVATGLETGVPWMVFVDTDTFFEPQAIYNLVDSADPIERPIVSGAQYGFMGAGPLTVLWVRWDEAHLHLVPIYQPTGKLEEIDGCGMGFCVIHRDVIIELLKLRPNDDWATFGHDQHWDPDTQRITYRGEDITFCLRAKALGFKIWGNPEVEVDHMKTVRQNRHTIDMRLKYDANGRSEVIK